MQGSGKIGFYDISYYEVFVAMTEQREIHNIPFRILPQPPNLVGEIKKAMRGDKEKIVEELSIWNEIFDPGVGREVMFKGKSALPQQALSRAALRYYSREEVRQGKGKKKALFVDIRGLGMADQVKDKNRNSLADYVLNLVVKELNSISGVEVVGRYGGDEFVVYGEGIDEEEIRKALKEIKDEEIEWLREGVGCKEVISLGDKQIQYFVDKGLIPSSEKDIENYKKGYRVLGEVRGETDALGRLKEIVEKHPELKEFKEIEEVVKEGKKGGITEVLTFIETIMFHPLFGEVVYAFSPFKDFIREGKFKQVLFLKTSFLKEINDRFSLETGDEFLKVYMGKIREVLQEKGLGRDNYVISMRGGLVMVGLRKEEEDLRDLDSDFQFNGINYPVGISMLELSDEELADKSVNEVLGIGIGRAELGWVRKMIEIIGLDKIEGILKEKEKGVENLGTLEGVLGVYFSHPERGEGRRELFERAIRELEEK